MDKVNVCEFKVSVSGVSDSFDYADVVDTIKAALVEALPDSYGVYARAEQIREMTHQGWLNCRARVYNVKVEEAGDGKNASKVIKLTGKNKATKEPEQTEQTATV